MNGAVSHVGKMISGESYDVAGRFGLQGITVINDLINSDKKWWELATGASGSVIGNAIAQSSGFRSAMMSLFKDRGESFPPKVEDFHDMLKEISTENRLYQSIVAWNTGIWFSKKDVYLTDVSQWKSFFMGATGLNPNDLSDIYKGVQIIKAQKALREEYTKDIISNMQRGYEALKNNQPEQAKSFFTRAATRFHGAGLQLEHEAEIIAKAAQGYESMVDTIKWGLITNAPMDKFNALIQQGIREQERKKAK